MQLGEHAVYDRADVEAEQLALGRVRYDHCDIEQVKK